jgi:hypothetical protein
LSPVCLAAVIWCQRLETAALYLPLWSRRSGRWSGPPATRDVKGKAHRAISLAPTLAQRTRKDGPPSFWLREKKECIVEKDGPPAWRFSVSRNSVGLGSCNLQAAGGGGPAQAELGRATLRSRLDAIGRATRRVRSITVQLKSARQGLPHNFPSRRPIAIPDSILRLWNYSIRVEALVLVCFG